MSRTRGEMNGRGMLFVGLTLLFVSGCLTLHSAWSEHPEFHTVGKVVSNRVEFTRWRGNQRNYYIAIVEYRDKDGEMQEAETNFGSLEPIAIGETLPVLVGDDNPARAEVGGLDYYGPAVGCAALGGFFLIWSFVLICGARLLDRLGVPMRR